MLAYRQSTLLLSVCLLGAGQASVQAQVVRPGYVPPTGAAARGYGYGQAGYVPGGYPVYSPYYQSRAEGYLNGVANVTSARAESEVTIQEARIQNEKAKQSQIDTRRAALEQWKYEQQFKPDAEQERLKEQQAAIQRAMNFPPSGEIWSGQALNAILLALKDAQYHQVFGANVPISPDVLRHVNLTDGTARGTGTTLTSEKMQWPTVLRGKDYEMDRSKFEQLLKLAVQQATSSKEVDPTVIDGLRATSKAIAAQVDKNIRAMTPDDWMGSKRYLRELDNTVETLGSQNVAAFVGGKWEAKGNSVQELVANMTQNGLQFAPATAGGESSYTVLHSAMVTYNISIQRLVAGGTPPPSP
jgi:hypothetical protein